MLTKKILLVWALLSLSFLSSISYAGKFAELYQRGGIGLCIQEARRSASTLAQSDQPSSQLLGQILAYDFIGNEHNQITELEYVELLDATALEGVVLEEDKCNPEDIPVEEFPLLTREIMSDAYTAGNSFIHGGSLSTVSKFLLEKSGYNTSKLDEKNSPIYGIWATPLDNQIISLDAAYQRTILYAHRKSPTFFDMPVAIIFDVVGDSKCIQKTQNNYECVIAGDNAKQIKNIKIYRLPRPLLSGDSLPSGGFKHDFSLHFQKKLSINVLSKLKKLYYDELFSKPSPGVERHKFNKNLIAQLQNYIKTDEGLTNLINEPPNQDYYENMWYESDTVNSLMHYYFGNLNLGIEYMHAISLTDGDGIVFVNNLRQRESRIETADRTTQIFTSRIMVPLLINGNHWVGLVIDRPLNGNNATVIHYFDPFGIDIPINLRTILEGIYQGAIFDVNNAIFQTDYHNCGPWVVEFFRNTSLFLSRFRTIGFGNDIVDIEAARTAHMANIRYVQQLSSVNHEPNKGILVSTDSVFPVLNNNYRLPIDQYRSLIHRIEEKNNYRLLFNSYLFKTQICNSCSQQK